MLWHGAKAGAFSLQSSVMESLESCIRAGASILITYFTPQILTWLDEQSSH
jgi:porphobilinogen synthase